MNREKCKVLENKKVAPGHFVLRFSSLKIPKNARPGQFVQIVCADSHEPLLPRPFSFLSVSKNNFSILYQTVGKGTQLLSALKKGDSRWITGPLGNGFSVGATRRVAPTVVLVGGGVGIPPLYHLACEMLKPKNKISKKDIHIFLGARHKDLLLCEKDFKKLGVIIHIATDDGSKGKKGFVTEILEEYLIGICRGEVSSPILGRGDRAPTNIRIYTCGPTPMLKAVSSISKKYQIPCEVSVEVPMACGFGACLGCAVRVKDTPKDEGRGAKDGDVDYRFAIACCEGPVFEADKILWD